MMAIDAWRWELGRTDEARQSAEYWLIDQQGDRYTVVEHQGTMSLSEMATTFAYLILMTPRMPLYTIPDDATDEEVAALSTPPGTLFSWHLGTLPDLRHLPDSAYKAWLMLTAGDQAAWHFPDEVGLFYGDVEEGRRLVERLIALVGDTASPTPAPGS